MAKRNYTVTFYWTGRAETKFAATKEEAMKLAYDRLDMAQRDFISLGEQGNADAMGKARGEMASRWHETVHHTKGWTRIYSGGFFNITRNV